MTWERNQHSVSKWVINATKMAFFGLITLLLLFLVNISLAPAALAQTNFSWEDDNVNYNGRTFTKQEAQNDNGKSFYVSHDGNKAHVITFEGDPKTAQKANYSLYDVNPDKSLSNPQNSTTLTNQTEGQDKETSSCTIKDIGWIVCPAAEHSAAGIDTIHDIIAGFMKIRPISLEQDSALMKAWRMMRNVANVMFIIAFLIIIMAYISNRGVDNYSVKKILPKLIIGTILVNLSFYICVLAVDLANVIGASIVSLFRSLQSGNDMKLSWLDLVKAILTGGTLTLAGLGAWVASFSFGGTVGILLAVGSAMVGVLVTLIVTLVILAARQALVITLIVISPLAFAATLLPNTEVYFIKWRNMMKKLLLLLPVFSLIYGSAQLASAIIIQSTASGDAITLVLAMLVQVIPFMMMPKLVKDSDTLMAKLSDGINSNLVSPLKSKYQGYFNRKVNERRQKYLATDKNHIYNVPRKLAQTFDKSKRITEQRTEQYKKLAESNYDLAKASASAKKGDRQLFRLKTLESLAEKKSADAKADLKTSQEILIANLLSHVSDAKNLDSGIASIHKIKGLENLKKTELNMIQQLARESVYNRIKKSEGEMVTEAQTMSYNKMLQKKMEIGPYRNSKKMNIIRANTGIFEGTEGTDLYVVNKVLAAAAKEKKESLDNITTAFDNYKVTTQDLVHLIEGKITSIDGTDTQGNTYTFNGSDDAVMEAAIRRLIQKKKVDTIKDEIVVETGKNGKFHKFAPAIAKYIEENGLGSVAVSLGNVTPNIIAQGILDRELMDVVNFSNTIKGRISPQSIAAQDKDETDDFTNSILRMIDYQFDNGKYARFNEFTSGDIDGSFGKSNAKEEINASLQAYAARVHDAINDPEVARSMKDASIKKYKIMLKVVENFTSKDGKVDIFSGTKLSKAELQAITQLVDQEMKQASQQALRDKQP